MLTNLILFLDETVTIILCIRVNVTNKLGMILNLENKAIKVKILLDGNNFQYLRG